MMANTETKNAEATTTYRPTLRDLAEELHRTLDKSGAGLGDATELTQSLLRDAYRERASDIHIEPREGVTSVRFRVDGLLHDVALLTTAEGNVLINQIKNMAGLDPVHIFTAREARWSFDVAEDAELDLRLTVMPCLSGTKLAIRMLDSRQVDTTINELGLSPEELEHLEGWISQISGLLLVVGPTGSGKTTTLYALLQELASQPRNIVTIEDPVEYSIDGVNQIGVNAEHGLSFANGLRALLRMDPDYVMLGEVRDTETAHITIEAAITGRALMSTLHARDAVMAVTALRNWGIRNHDIAATLSLVICQRLVRRLCPECRRQTEPSVAEERWLRGLRLEIPETVWQPKGCDACRGTGYHGRIGVFELWNVTPEEHHAIIHGADDQSLRELILKREFMPLLAKGLMYAKRGTTSISELQAMGELIPPPPHVLERCSGWTAAD